MKRVKLKRLTENTDQAESFEEFFGLDASPDDQKERDVAADFADLRDRGLLSPTDYVLAMASHLPEKWLTVTLSFTLDSELVYSFSEEDAIAWLKNWFVSPGEYLPEGCTVDPDSIYLDQWPTTGIEDEDWVMDYDMLSTASLTVVFPREAFSKEKMDDWAEKMIDAEFNSMFPFVDVQYSLDSINESENSKSFEEFFGLDSSLDDKKKDAVAAIRELRSRGFVNDSDYAKLFMKIAKENGQKVTDILEPGERIFNIERIHDDGVPWEIDDFLKEWTGPRGEVIVFATGETSNDWYKVESILSNGVELHTEQDRWWGESVWLIADGVKIELPTDTFNGIYDQYEEDGDWETYMTRLLDSIMDASY